MFISCGRLAHGGSLALLTSCCEAGFGRSNGGLRAKRAVVTENEGVVICDVRETA